MGKGGKKKGKEAGGKAEKAEKPGKPRKGKGPVVPLHLVRYADAAPLTGAKKIKKKCCRSTPRCKGCPVLLMRAARLTEAGVTGKDLKKALKKARAA
ncbi:hypothetical protein ACFPK1_21605 [Actinomycetospora rhizophila]|uniref:Uncharacterized protein n=1 Tax=Actinomycetospora rhizophila TaxID=1416876 RepID=A0ABV9ZH14_9PSEU